MLRVAITAYTGEELVGYWKDAVEAEAAVRAETSVMDEEDVHHTVRLELVAPGTYTGEEGWV